MECPSCEWNVEELVKCEHCGAEVCELCAEECRPDWPEEIDIVEQERKAAEDIKVILRSFAQEMDDEGADDETDEEN